MNLEEKALNEVKENELKLDLYDFKVLNTSVWRLVRFSARISKLNRELDYTNRTSQIKTNIGEVFLSYIKSFFQLLFFFFRKKRISNLILAFPRLTIYNNAYIDKFTDPIISQTRLKDQTLVLQRNLSGKHFKPRHNSGAIYIVSDFIDYSSKVLGIFFFPLIYIWYYFQIKFLYKKASSYFFLSKRFKLIIGYKIGEFLAHYFFARLFLKLLKVKQLFLVNRLTFLPFIVAAKKEKIKVFELQHGITHSETVLYTGFYQKEIDPDIFLTFGEKWRGEQFSIPIDHQINIGWAYNKWILKEEKEKLVKNSVLVVSSPAITDSIILTTIELAKLNESYSFSIRLHPQEDLTQQQIETIFENENIVLDDRKVDSLASILKHEYIVGENSSVLYEALSLNKPVGKIMFNKLESKAKLDDLFEGITYLYSKDDFKILVKNKNFRRNFSGIYDIFDVQKFNNLLE